MPIAAKLYLRAASLALLGCALAAPAIAQAKPSPLTVQGDHFLLNGKPFVIRSGEMHYARIPRAYWRQRMEMAKAMGLNTIATYIFWNVHEPQPGQFDFSGNNDVAAFIRLAQQEGLHVVLRTGPYSCAEWEFGGFPYWLLKDPRMSTALRTNDDAYMVPVEAWLARLSKELVPLLAANGGPILAVQVENERGNIGAGHDYMEHLRQVFLKDGFGQALLYTADPQKSLPNGSIPELLAGVNSGPGHAEQAVETIHTMRPGTPVFVSEYWPGWFDHWGEPHSVKPIGPQLADLEYMLKNNVSFNIYMFHGGTSFGFMSGASWSGNAYHPDVTSYDYDAPLDEAGHATAKYAAYRGLIAKYTPQPLPAVPGNPPVVEIAPFSLDQAASLWDTLPKPVSSDHPQTMESLNQAYGYVLYRTQLTAAAHGDLVLSDVHDYAQVYIDGKLAGTVDRAKKQDRVALNTEGPARLDVLVENEGRINSTKMMRTETKGIVGANGAGGEVTLNGKPLAGWKIYSLPMTNTASAHFSKAAISGPAFYRGQFNATASGDVFLDVRQLGKGALWINGHPIGRFWSIGPQQTLYVPGAWLHRGANEVVVFDEQGKPNRTLSGLAKPILDAPVAGAFTKED